MTSECSSHTIELEQVENVECKVVVKRDWLLSRIWQLWPVKLAMRAYRGFWWLFGFSPKDEEASTSSAGTTPPRQCVAGRKRLRWVTRILLSILPRRMQSALGYPVCTSIGRSLSPEVSISPTKPCGKGSKRKQDEVDEDEGEQNQTWVEALTQELAEDEDSEEDPNYQPSVEETDTEEYCSHNNTESDIEVAENGQYIKDLKTDDQPTPQ